MKDLFIALGSIRFAHYLLLSLINVAPLIHILIIKTDLTLSRAFLTFIGLLFFMILSSARVYRKSTTSTSINDVNQK